MALLQPTDLCAPDFGLLTLLLKLAGVASLKSFAGLVQLLEIFVPQNRPPVASGHTCLGLDEASTLSVSDTWNMASSRKFLLRQRRGKEGAGSSRREGEEKKLGQQ